MADNFLEKRQDAYRMQAAARVQHKAGNSVQRLLEKCAASVDYDTSYVVREDQLSGMLSIGTLVERSEVFSFSVLRGDEAVGVLPDGAVGLLVRSAADASYSVRIRVGMILQAMMLRASEIGLHASIIQCKSDDSSVSVLLAVGRPIAVHTSADIVF